MNIKQFFGLLLSYFLMFGGLLVLIVGIDKWHTWCQSPIFCIIGGMGGILSGILLYTEIKKDINKWNID